MSSPHKKAIYFMNVLHFVISFHFFPGASAGPPLCLLRVPEDVALPEVPGSLGRSQHSSGWACLPPQFLLVFPVVMGSETASERECPTGRWPPSMRASGLTERWRRGTNGDRAWRRALAPWAGSQTSTPSPTTTVCTWRPHPAQKAAGVT